MTTRIRLSRWLLIAGFVLTIFSSKLWLIATAGTDLPLLDQWDAEGETLLRPWVEGSWRWSQLFDAHNEHRIPFTRLFGLGLFELNERQWDGYVESVAAATVHTLCALVLLLIAGRLFTGARFGGVVILLLALFCLPLSPENTLVGFQVQFYLLLLFSLGHLWFTLTRSTFSASWWVGQLCGVLTLGTMASGFLSSAAILGVLALRGIQERRWTTQQITSAAIALAIAIAGVLLMREVPAHAALRAQSPGQFLESFLVLIGWPGEARYYPWTAALSLPVIVFALSRLRRGTWTREDAFLFGLIVWMAVQTAALAYGRGILGRQSMLSPNRYLDLLAVNVLLNFLVLLRSSRTRLQHVIAAVWLVCVCHLLVRYAQILWRSDILRDVGRNHRREINVRDYLRTGDARHLSEPPASDIPYPSPEALQQRLASPAIADAMPPSVHRPLPLVGEAAAAPRALPDAFPAPPGALVLSTWTPPGAGESGELVWRSRPQPANPARPYLRFHVAGDFRANNPSLELILKSATGDVALRPRAGAKDAWQRLESARPDGDWWIEVRDASASGWLAFTAPVEMARGSWVAHRVLAARTWLFALGVLLLGASLVLQLKRHGGPATRPAVDA